MLEQEIASVIRFVLDSAGNPNPYYYSVPESFIVPAVYFPSPEINTGGETFRTYRMEYAWYITFHHKTSEDAYRLAQAALTAIMGRRCLIPLIKENGEYAGRGLRVNNPSIKPLDTGVYQLALSFVSRRPYDAEQVEKMQSYEVEAFLKSPDEAAVQAAVAKYLSDGAG